MGYYVTVDMWISEFANEKDAEKFVEEVNKEDVGGNPFFKNCCVAKYPGEDKTCYEIELFERVVKLNDYHKWIPFIATLKLKAVIDFYGDDLGDIFRVEYYGNGEFSTFTADISYENIPLEFL
ncbi:MAG: hypothetical protein Q8M92_01255 [Candidatus Subteraquimicrobiales bacterium]|nr:hypothetical protein [Candidatus Subteraquimicrobiales bacterium]